MICVLDNFLIMYVKENWHLVIAPNLDRTPSLICGLCLDGLPAISETYSSNTFGEVDITRRGLTATKKKKTFLYLK